MRRTSFADMPCSVARTLEVVERVNRVATRIDFEGRVDIVADPGQMTIGLLAAGGVVHVRGGEVADAYARLAEAAGDRTKAGWLRWNDVQGELRA